MAAQHAISVVAHQGGWDEILLVAGPIIVVVALLALAKRRVDRNVSDRQTHDVHDDHSV